MATTENARVGLDYPDGRELPSAPSGYQWSIRIVERPGDDVREFDRVHRLVPTKEAAAAQRQARQDLLALKGEPCERPAELLQRGNPDLYQAVNAGGVEVQYHLVGEAIYQWYYSDRTDVVSKWSKYRRTPALESAIRAAFASGQYGGLALYGPH